jgi:hypothetical protein
LPFQARGTPHPPCRNPVAVKEHYVEVAEVFGDARQVLGARFAVKDELWPAPPKCITSLSLEVWPVSACHDLHDVPTSETTVGDRDRSPVRGLQATAQALSYHVRHALAGGPYGQRNRSNPCLRKATLGARRGSGNPATAHLHPRFPPSPRPGPELAEHGVSSGMSSVRSPLICCAVPLQVVAERANQLGRDGHRLGEWKPGTEGSRTTARRRAFCCEPEQRLSGRLLSVNAALASLIAVAGTLLGSLITYRFQRLSTDRAEAFARDERLREERLATYSAFAGAISDLRRAVITLWFRQRDKAEEREIAAAWVEADRLGAAAAHARFRVQLVAEDADLVALADAASETDQRDRFRQGPKRAARVRKQMPGCTEGVHHSGSCSRSLIT